MVNTYVCNSIIHLLAPVWTENFKLLKEKKKKKKKRPIPCIKDNSILFKTVISNSILFGNRVNVRAADWSLNFEVRTNIKKLSANIGDASEKIFRGDYSE